VGSTLPLSLCSCTGRLRRGVQCGEYLRVDNNHCDEPAGARSSRRPTRAAIAALINAVEIVRDRRSVDAKEIHRHRRRTQVHVRIGRLWRRPLLDRDPVGSGICTLIEARDPYRYNVCEFGDLP